MPKLPSAAAQAAQAAAESGGFAPLEPGRYRVRLVEVEAKTARSSGNPMWVWKLETDDDEMDSHGKFLWVNSVLTDKAMWKVGEMFAAFDADTETDTDELIGEFCYADVVQRPITEGARAGQTGNDVQRCYSLEETTAETGGPTGTTKAPAGAKAGGEGW